MHTYRYPNDTEAALKTRLGNMMQYVRFPLMDSKDMADKVCVSVSVSVCLYVRVCVCVCASMFLSLSLSLSLCICVCVHTHKCMHTYIQVEPTNLIDSALILEAYRYRATGGDTGRSSHQANEYRRFVRRQPAPAGAVCVRESACECVY